MLHALEGARGSFDRKLSLRFALVIICTAFLAFVIVAPTYRDYTLARHNLFDMQRFRLMLDTATLLAAERGPANNAMSTGSSPDGEKARRLAEFRARSDAALAQLTNAADVPLGLYDDELPLELLQNVREQLAVARAEVDRVVARSGAGPSREEFQRAIDSMFEVSNRFRAIVAWKANHLVEQDSGLAALALVGPMLSDLRDYGGRIASQIMASIAVGERLPLDNVIEARRIEGRLLELWQVSNNHAGLFNNPALQTSRVEIQRRFFGEGLGLVDSLIREGRRDAPYSLTSTELTERFVPTMRPIEAYRRAFLDAAVDHYARARDKALAILATVALFATCALGILARLMVSIRKNIFQPLIRVHDEVIRLAEDRPAQPMSLTGKAGEIRSLFRAIEVLQDKLQERASITASITSELQAQADTDGLTALLNRRALDRYARRVADAEPAVDAACLILLDIDHFKSVNDTYGHPTGDRVLIQTAELLRSHLRASDLVARFGGEEFAILVPGNDLPGTVAIARKIRLAIQTERFTTPDGTPVHVTASFGVARGQRGERTWPELVELADEALYQAKSDGRNRVRCAQTVAVADLGAPDEASVALVGVAQG
ncbi:GGDEF domain-containing protein [Bradyrhizobium sp. CER78]|uniref:GGDEF domain-containing protein n=1 Tax=Bradyrhizobium sp. CER78 TaxID=3039162 RepID=UPI00244BBC1F|nr:GGDEF domain-containing protein [Bradyrhizobium sp. CER78]MDH2386040.1 GGDEF domain-containing protein [Bradyrhizobium sp. CER78]